MKDYKQPEKQILKSVLYFSLGFLVKIPSEVRHRTHSYRRSQALALYNSLRIFLCASFVLIII